MAARITISYLPEPIIDPKTKEIIGKVERPKIPIYISVGRKRSHLFHALINSGADKNLLPAEIGELVGININSGKRDYVYGIGNSKITIYEHIVSLHIARLSFKVPIDFSYEHKLPLLGRQGFFDLFKKVSFNEHKRQVEIKI